jgi:hypothetical protein
MLPLPLIKMEKKKKKNKTKQKTPIVDGACQLKGDIRVMNAIMQRSIFLYNFHTIVKHMALKLVPLYRMLRHDPTMGTHGIYFSL